MSRDVFRKLDKAEELEQAARRLYLQLAGRLGASPSTAETLRALADEEAQHALRLRMLRDRYARQPSIVEGVTLDLAEMDAILSEVAVLEEFFAREPFAMSVKEAACFMIQLEERFAAAHAHAMINTSDELRDFFQSLAKQDVAHARVLAGLG